MRGLLDGGPVVGVEVDRREPPADRAREADDPSSLLGQLHSWGAACDDLVALARHESSLGSLGIVVEDVVEELRPPQPTRRDLRARQRADDRAAEARMSHQHAHQPRARRRH